MHQALPTSLGACAQVRPEKFPGIPHRCAADLHPAVGIVSWLLIVASAPTPALLYALACSFARLFAPCFLTELSYVIYRLLARVAAAERRELPYTRPGEQPGDEKPSKNRSIAIYGRRESARKRSRECRHVFNDRAFAGRVANGIPRAINRVTLFSSVRATLDIHTYALYPR